jgi:tetratricopeptide (TPR) repeat protein
VPSHARATLDRLLGSDICAHVRRGPLSIEVVTDWVDHALGVEAIPDAGILSLHERAGGRPERVRVLLAEEMRRGALARNARGFEWRGGPPAPAEGTVPPTRSREALLALAAEIDLPLPESVVAIYLDVPQAELLDFVTGGVLSMDTPGHFAGHEEIRNYLQNGQVGGAREARERLARSVELAMPFPGQAERAAREWLRAARPLRAAPCLLAAAQDALAGGLRDRGDGGARAAQLLENAGRVLDRCRQEVLGPAEIEAVESLERELGRASIRLARARGRHDDWERAASRLIERGIATGHAATVEVALEALMQLAIDRSDREGVNQLLRQAKAMPVISGPSFETWGLAWLDARDGRTEQALRRLAGLPRESLDARRQMLLALLESDIALDGGRLEQAERALARAWAGAERSRDDRALQQVMLGRVRLMHLQQRPGRARELALDLVRQIGDRRAYRIDGRLTLERARIELSLGRPEAAIEAAIEAEEQARRDVDADTAALAVMVRAEALVCQRELERCGVLLKAAMGPGLVSLPRIVRRETELRVILAALTHAGDSQREAAVAERNRSIRTARDLAEAAEAEGYRELVQRALLLAAEGALNAGDGPQAAQYLRDLEDRVERWGEVGAPWHAVWWCQAEAARLTGDTEIARRRHHLARTAVRRLAGLIARNEDRISWLEGTVQARILARGDG